MRPIEAEAAIQRDRSRELYQSALLLEPNGVAGSDIRAPRAGWEPFPPFMAQGQGAYLVDVDGNRYIDYVAAQGPLILGHKPPRVLEAAYRTLDDMGPLLGFDHELEVKAGRATVDAVPCWEQMRFCNTGTEAVMLALRIARSYTSRTRILRFEGHFHGWSDTIYFDVDPELVRAGTESDLGAVPTTHGMVESLSQTQVMRQWNNPEILRQTFADFGDQLAAVICEPLIATPPMLPDPEYLELLRELCTKHGVVLIFDEVKTGFRVALGGAQELFGVLPDLSTAAKAMGAGFPVAAVGGRSELFEPFERGYIRQGSCYQANPMVLAATLATLQELRQPGFYERLNGLGERLTQGLDALANEAGLVAYARGIGSIVQLVFADHVVNDFRDSVRSVDRETYKEFFKAMMARGVMMTPGGNWFVSDAHNEDDVETTLESASEVLMGIAADRR